MTDDQKRLKALLSGYKDSDRKEMCNAGIELCILKDEDIKYIMNPAKSFREVAVYYHKKIMEM